MSAATTTPSLHRRRYSSADPRRRTIGWAVVVLVHIFVGWALVSGTARRGLEIVQREHHAQITRQRLVGFRARAGVAVRFRGSKGFGYWLIGIGHDGFRESYS